MHEDSLVSTDTGTFWINESEDTISSKSNTTSVIKNYKFRYVRMDHEPGGAWYAWLYLYVSSDSAYKYIFVH